MPPMPMPMSMAEDDMMGDAFYSAPDKGKAKEAEDETETVDEEEDENPTALVPTSALGGAKEGDTITVKVVKLYGDEAEVELSSAKTKPMPKTPQSSDEELDEIDSRGY